MPETITETITVYTFAELSDSAKKTVIQQYAESMDYEWWDACEESLRTAAEIMGIIVDRAYFSGFWSQGDGACFTGSYYYKPGSCKAIRREFPEDKRLHAIADALRDAQRPFFYRLNAAIASNDSRYSHENSVSVDVEYDCDDWREFGDAEDEITDALRDLMRWYYRLLESEYEYLTSEEAVAESAEANGWRYLEDGTLH